MPRLLSYLQVLGDEEGRNGLFVFTGSEQSDLTDTISQSLAGRPALVRLLPFSLAERRLVGAPDGIEQMLYSGCYPRIHDEAINPTPALSEYCTAYIERDARRIGGISNVAGFRRFVRLCAGRVGQIVNLSNLGADAGIAHTAVRMWVDVIEAMDVVFRLEPYRVNIRQWLTKSPKIYYAQFSELASPFAQRTQRHISGAPPRRHSGEQQQGPGRSEMQHCQHRMTCVLSVTRHSVQHPRQQHHPTERARSHRQDVQCHRMQAHAKDQIGHNDDYDERPPRQGCRRRMENHHTVVVGSVNANRWPVATIHPCASLGFVALGGEPGNFCRLAAQANTATATPRSRIAPTNRATTSRSRDSWAQRWAYSPRCSCLRGRVWAAGSRGGDHGSARNERR